MDPLSFMLGAAVAAVVILLLVGVSVLWGWFGERVERDVQREAARRRLAPRRERPPSRAPDHGHVGDLDNPDHWATGRA